MLDKLIVWVDACSTVASVVIVVALVAALFRRFRSTGGIVMLLATWVWGFDLWLVCLRNVLTLWGVWPVVLGLALGGVGIVPVALIAELFTKRWELAAGTALALALLIAFRFLGARLAAASTN